MSEKKARKVVQIATSSVPDEPDILYALCNDGTIWSLNLGARTENHWQRAKDIPQPEEQTT